MRCDFRSVLTHGQGTRYPDAEYVRSRILDDDGTVPMPRARARTLDKGWCEGSNLRHNLIGRYLRSQVGRRWDAVRSDLCRALDPALRLRFVDGCVEEGCRIGEDGIVRDARGRRVADIYVDPRDGVLRDVPRRSWSAAYRLRERRRLLVDPDAIHLTEPFDPERRVELRRVDGVWYAFAYRRSDAPSRSRNTVLAIRYDVRCDVFEDLVSKRQIPSAEIRRLRLGEWAEGAGRLREAVASGRDEPRIAERLETIRRAAIKACLAG
jgi:hypothetical protein